MTSNRHTNWLIEIVFFAVCCLKPPLFAAWAFWQGYKIYWAMTLKRRSKEYAEESKRIAWGDESIDLAVARIALIWEDKFGMPMGDDERVVLRDMVEKERAQKAHAHIEIDRRRTAEAFRDFSDQRHQR